MREGGRAICEVIGALQLSSKVATMLIFKLQCVEDNFQNDHNLLLPPSPVRCTKVILKFKLKDSKLILDQI